MVRIGAHGEPVARAGRRGGDARVEVAVRVREHRCVAAKHLANPIAARRHLAGERLVDQLREPGMRHRVRLDLVTVRRQRAKHLPINRPAVAPANPGARES